MAHTHCMLNKQGYTRPVTPTPRPHTHTQTNYAPQCYVIRTLPVLLTPENELRRLPGPHSRWGRFLRS